jgi:hypothetical protein
MAAEALGVVSGGFAVVSLALQLLDTAQQFHTFWQSFGESGSNVRRIKDHVATLHTITAIIAETCQQNAQLQNAESVINSLFGCKARIDKLAHLTGNIQADRRAGRWEKGWISLRATLKDKTITKIEAELNWDVIMLILALQPFFQ